MAFKSVRISDLTGSEGTDAEFTTVVVRSHPNLSEPVQFDAKPEELKGLKSAGDLVELELKNGESKRVVVTLAEFNKLNPDMAGVLKNARGLRGRAPGFRPPAKSD